MATSTTNFGLTKPAYSDTADISDINGNMETIDTKLAEGVYYGTCSTAAGTQQKDVTAANFPAVLSAGMKLSVKFTNGQTFNGQPTLKVNSLTAKNICSFGTTAAAQYEWQAGEVIDFIYDGTQWVVVNGGIAGTTYYGKTKLTSDLTGTSEWLAATQKAVNTLNSNLAKQIGVIQVQEGIVYGHKQFFPAYVGDYAISFNVVSAATTAVFYIYLSVASDGTITKNNEFCAVNGAAATATNYCTVTMKQ